MKNKKVIKIVGKLKKSVYDLYDLYLRSRNLKVILDKRINLYYDRSSDIGKILFKTGKFEEAEVIFFSNRLKNKHARIFFDIGANIGLHSIAWLRDNPTAKSYAFEPAGNTRNILKKNIERNLLGSRLEIIPCAVSDSSGFGNFYNCDDNAYSSLKDTKRKKIKNVENVEVITLDDFCKKKSITSIDLIKIDVEGFENEVIEGARKTLERYTPDLFIEIYQGQNSNSQPQKLINYLIEIGYNAFIFCDGTVRPFLGKHDDKFYNYFFTKDFFVQT